MLYLSFFLLIGRKTNFSCADVRCDVARGAEELVCVLVRRGSCEKKEKEET